MGREPPDEVEGGVSTHYVIAESLQPVRGPRCTIHSTHDSYDAAVAAAEKALGERGGYRYHVAEQVATTAVVTVTTRTTSPRHRPCFGCSHDPHEHPNDSGCEQWHGGPNR